MALHILHTSIEHINMDWFVMQWKQKKIKSFRCSQCSWQRWRYVFFEFNRHSKVLWQMKNLPKNSLFVLQINSQNYSKILECFLIPHADSPSINSIVLSQTMVVVLLRFQVSANCEWTNYWKGKYFINWCTLADRFQFSGEFVWMSFLLHFRYLIRHPCHC